MRSIVLVAILLAGCSGAEPAQEPVTDEPIADGDPVEFAQKLFEDTGTATAVDAVLVSMRPMAIVSPEESFTFTVPDNATDLRLTFDVSHPLGQEASLSIWADGCGSPACRDEYSTSGGKFEETFAPEGGTWTITVWADGPGGGRYDWSATAAVTVPA